MKASLSLWLIDVNLNKTGTNNGVLRCVDFNIVYNYVFISFNLKV
jgi:hypothetical protein